MARLRSALVLLAVALTASAPARAEDAKDPKGKAPEPETVVVTGTRTPERAQRATVKPTPSFPS